MAAAAVDRLQGHDPVFSIMALHANLRHDPWAWVGRTVQVRAIAQVCTVSLGILNHKQSGPCAAWQPIQLVGTDTHSLPLALLLSAGAMDDGQPLPLVTVPGSRLLMFLRQIPLVEHTVPVPQAVHWGIVAVYRVQLRAARCAAGVPPPCYAAVLRAGAR
jgi:hypothetical protein